jgi:hypothetical protein
MSCTSPGFYFACCLVASAAPSQLNRDDVHFSTGPYLSLVWGVWPLRRHSTHHMKSLILAQDERWRRA